MTFEQFIRRKWGIDSDSTATSLRAESTDSDDDGRTAREGMVGILRIRTLISFAPRSDACMYVRRFSGAKKKPFFLCGWQVFSNLLLCSLRMSVKRRMRATVVCTIGR